MGRSYQTVSYLRTDPTKDGEESRIHQRPVEDRPGRESPEGSLVKSDGGMVSMHGRGIINPIALRVSLIDRA